MSGQNQLQTPRVSQSQTPLRQAILLAAVLPRAGRLPQGGGGGDRMLIKVGV